MNFLKSILFVFLLLSSILISEYAYSCSTFELKKGKDFIYAYNMDLPYNVKGFVVINKIDFSSKNTIIDIDASFKKGVPHFERWTPEKNKKLIFSNINTAKESQPYFKKLFSPKIVQTFEKLAEYPKTLKSNAPIYNPKVTEKEKAKFEKSFNICPAVGDKIVTDILKPIRQKFKLPAIGAAIVSDKEIIAGAVGITKEGTQVPVKLDDRWQIGSCTKTMTATIIAHLIEQDKLKWETTIGDIFPKLAPSFNSEFKNITVIELLSQHSGLQRDLYKSPFSWFKWKGQGTPTEQRLKILKIFSKKKLLFKPGTKWSYSNVGYIIAGAVIDKVSGISYEQAMKKYIFEPLCMNNSGFERYDSNNNKDHLWSHYFTGKPTQFYIIHPFHVMNSNGASTYCSISDWSKFIQDQLSGAGEQAGLLKASTYKKLQTPPYGGNGALGWILKDGALWHNGTDTLNQAIVYMYPKKGYAVLFCTNIGFDLKNAPKNDNDIPVIKAGNEVCKKLGQYYLNHQSKIPKY